MFAAPILLFFLIAVLLYFSPNWKHLFRAFIINIVIILLYNYVLWAYIFKEYPSGGASLWPGLLLLFFTGLHLLCMVIYAAFKFKKPEIAHVRTYVDMIDELLNILKTSGRLAEYQRLKDDLSTSKLPAENCSLTVSTLLYYQEKDPFLNDLIKPQLAELMDYCHFINIFPKVRADMD